jgi:murein DD-endopeptidase MepM/ murein hydrolase activator NlpD
MKNPKWYLGGALSVTVTAALVVTLSPPAVAEPLPLPTGGPVPTLPGLPIPTLPALPVPTRRPALPALPPTPVVNPPAPPAARPAPLPAAPAPQVGAPPGTPPAPGQAAPQPGATTPGTAVGGAPVLDAATTPDAAAAIIAGDPGADLYPQPPVDPATTPQSRLVARLNEVHRREQYLQNVLVRTRADLATARARLGAVQPLVALLTTGAGADAPAAPGSVGTPEGRVLALSAAMESGRSELARRQNEALELGRQVDSYAAQAVAITAPVTPNPANQTNQASYGGGRLLRPVRGAFTSAFGNRFDPYYRVWQLHAGIDIGAPSGAEIVAAAAGRVTQAGWSGGYGNYTCIDHGQIDGQRLSTCYGHQQKIMVTPGQRVSAGQVIGLVGSTGASTGPHLHFEVRLSGRPVDPKPWL